MRFFFDLVDLVSYSYNIEQRNGEMTMTAQQGSFWAWDDLTQARVDEGVYPTAADAVAAAEAADAQYPSAVEAPKVGATKKIAAHSAADQWVAVGRGAKILAAQAIAAKQWGLLQQAKEIIDQARSGSDITAAAIMGYKITAPDPSNRIIKIVFDAGMEASREDVAEATAAMEKNEEQKKARRQAGRKPTIDLKPAFSVGEKIDVTSSHLNFKRGNGTTVVCRIRDKEGGRSKEHFGSMDLPEGRLPERVCAVRVVENSVHMRDGIKVEFVAELV